MTLLDTLLQPFQFEFMRYALIISVLVAIPTALLSCFLVLKGWSLMGDAVSHAVLPGVVLAHVAGVPLIFGAFGAGMLCALATGYLAENSRVKQDTVMGVVFSGMFGVGIILFTSVETDQHLDHILFGNMLGIGAGDLATSGAISAAVTLILGAAYTLWLVKRVVFGPVGNDHVQQLEDLNGREFLVLGVLALAVLALGLWPAPLLEVMRPTIEHLVQQMMVTKF